MFDFQQVIADAKHTFTVESQALMQLVEQLTDDFALATKAILNCQGKTIVTGMGKSGIIGKKIAATLSSTGTPSFFLHPGEAYHGDLGMISPNDVVIAISNSGETDEILKIIPFLHTNKQIIVGMTGNPNSTLARNAHYHLNIHVDKEACPLALAPTSSTTATLAMGDALAVALMNARNFQSEDFARFHPGGSLGRRLLTRVQDVMYRENLPTVSADINIKHTIHAITKGGLGLAVVLHESGSIEGIVTDGDIRRAMELKEEEFFSLKAGDLMTTSPKTILPDAKITEAEKVMNQHNILALLVAESNNILLGVLPYKDVFLNN